MSKKFFDEAAGIKEFQIKRHHAVLKLHATKENLHETKMLLQEIEPRLNSLRRQVKRLEKREVVEKELHENYLQYYGAQWVTIDSQFKKLKKQHHDLEIEKNKREKIYEQAFSKMQALEVEEKKSDSYTALQKEYDQVYGKRSSTREEILRLKNAVEMAKLKATTQKKWAPLPLSKIIAELEQMHDEVAAASNKDSGAIKSLFGKFSSKIKGLIERLQQPAPEKQEFKDEKALAQIDELEKTLLLLDKEAADIQDRITAANKAEHDTKSSFFALQKDLQQRQHDLHKVEQQLSMIAIDLAKVETRRETLEEEINREVPDMRDKIMKVHAETVANVQVRELQSEVYRLRRQLELIGGIDEETVKEYEETEKRFTFLSGQVEDLESAMKSIDKAIGDLDEVMTKKRKVAFTSINKEFERFFKILFDGGKAGIIEIKAKSIN